MKKTHKLFKVYKYHVKTHANTKKFKAIFFNFFNFFFTFLICVYSTTYRFECTEKKIERLKLLAPLKAEERLIEITYHQLQLLEKYQFMQHNTKDITNHFIQSFQLMSKIPRFWQNTLKEQIFNLSEQIISNLMLYAEFKQGSFYLKQLKILILGLLSYIQTNFGKKSLNYIVVLNTMSRCYEMMKDYQRAYICVKKAIKIMKVECN